MVDPLLIRIGLNIVMNFIETDSILSGVISNLIVSIVTGVAVWAYQSAKMGGLRKVLVFPPSGDQLNTKFYTYFGKQIDRAKTEIIVTGEGFEYKGSDGPRLAGDYHDRMLSALGRGVHITRIQSGRHLRHNERWADALKECIRHKSKRFHLYIVDNKQFQDAASHCVIDADTKNNVVELMFSAEKDLEDSSVRIASTGVFIHGQEVLADAMKKNILAIRNSSITTKCETEADIDRFLNLPEGDHLNFAYGSNMSEEQMHRRCPSARKLGVAYLPAHNLAFNRKGSYRDGGVASVVPSATPTDRVYGIVWALNDEDVQKLDEIEGPAAYERKTIRVIGDHGGEIECHTYIAIPQADFVIPDREYLSILLSAAHAQGLPDDYIKTISKFQATVEP